MQQHPYSDPLQAGDRYPCPVCRIGKVSTMPLMNTWGCGFCGQWFEADEKPESLRSIDPVLSKAWDWDGRQWHRQLAPELQPAWLWQGLSILLVTLPTALVGLSVYLFSPEPDSFLHELPVIWIGLTCLAHLMLVLYLMTEYYQVPFSTYWQTLQRFWARPARR